MTLNSKDWKKLQTPIFSLLIALITVGSLISLTMNFEENKRKQLDLQQSQFRIAQQKFLSSGSEKDDIIAFLPQYQALIDKGFIGEEQRQAWIQTLQDIQKAYRLFPIEYRLNPLAETQPPFLPYLGGFTLHQSQMNLNFDMLHEGDLLQLTDALANKHLANWLLRSCLISRIDTLQANSAMLNARCIVDWYTLSEPMKSLTP
jgi:hypothetical protein